MSPEIPPAPPEADVIRLARKAADMTAEGAAEATRAHDGKGISATYWRDVERGRGGRRGRQVPVRASDRVLAAMARVVGVTPAQLTGAGREDAARVLDEALRRERSSPPGTATPAPPSGWLAADAIARVQPYTDRLWLRIRDLALDGIADPTGADLFGKGTEDAADWDSYRRRGLPVEQRVWQLAALVAYTRPADEREQGTGLARGHP